MKIITDTGSMMKQEYALQHDITLLPLQVAVKGQNYRDYFELKSADFVELIKDAVPVSSQPAIGEVMEVYEAVTDSLHITMTKGLSATYESAKGIKESMNANHITLFNSKTLAGAQKYLVELASSLKDTHSISEIIERLEKCLTQCQSYLIPADFDFLRRGGRLSPMAATLGGLMKIKPIVTQTEGSEKLEKLAVGRSWALAIDKIIEKMKENGVSAKHKVFISHAFNEDVASLALQRIQNAFDAIETEILELSPVMITQGGPGCVAIQYILKDSV